MRPNEKNIKKIFSVSSGFCEVEDMLSNAKNALLDSNDELFNSYLKGALIKAEKSYVRLRKYISDAIESPTVKKEILQKEVNNSKIKISKLGNGIIKITMPIILPFKKLKTIRAHSEEYTHIEFTDTLDRVNCFTSLLFLKRLLMISKKKTIFLQFICKTLRFCIKIFSLKSI